MMHHGNTAAQSQDMNKMGMKLETSKAAAHTSIRNKPSCYPSATTNAQAAAKKK